MILFEDKIKTNKDAFLIRLKAISASLGIVPDWLMLVINSESAGTFDPQIVNRQSKEAEGYDGDGVLVKPKGQPDSLNAYERAAYRATGLIQFMPKTAKELGTSTQELYKMSNVAQLEYIYKYFLPLKGRIRSFEDLYLYTFYPYAVGKGDDYIIGSERSMDYAKELARENPIDKDNKGHITVSDFKNFIYSRIPSMLLDEIKKKSSQPLGNMKEAS